MNTINPRVHQLGPPDHTILIDTNLCTSNVATNRLINWEEKTFLEHWTINNVVPPKPIVNNYIEQIIQDDNGSVSISFGDSLIRNYSRSLSSRGSFSFSKPYKISIPTTSRHSISEQSEPSMVESVNIEGLRISENQIPHAIYQIPHAI